MTLFILLDMAQLRKKKKTTLICHLLSYFDEKYFLLGIKSPGVSDGVTTFSDSVLGLMVK